MLRLPTTEQKLKIWEFLNEDPNTRDEAIETIKIWLKNHPHLPSSWDEQCILSFLRGSRFSIETCKKKLEKYFTFRATLPEFFCNRNIQNPELKQLAEIVDSAVLPFLTPDGRRVSIARAAKQDFETPNLADLFKVVFMAGDLRLILEQFGVMSDIYIFDLNFPLFKHFLRINPMVVKRFLKCVQEAYPVIISEIHLINAPVFVEIVVSCLKTFMSQSLKDAIHVHTGVDTLYDFVPKSCLPQEYGGTIGKLSDFKHKWIDIFMEYSDWFKKEEEIKTQKNKIVQNDDNEEVKHVETK